MSAKLNNQDDRVPEDAFDESMPMSEILAAIRESIADENKDEIRRATPSVVKEAASTSDDDILDLTVEVDPDGKSLAEGTGPQDETPVASMQADALSIGDDLIAMELEDPDGDIDALIEAAEASENANAGANEVSVIEAFVGDLVRDWLDKNMPKIVEDVVVRELAKKTDI